MDDYQVEGLAVEISRIAKELQSVIELKDLNLIADELKKIRVLMAADLLLKTFQHTHDGKHGSEVDWPISELMDIVQDLKYDDV